MFWGKKPVPLQAGKDNPFRASDPVTFDKGERINRRADELQRAAIEGLDEAEGLTALGNALGNAVTAMVRRHPHLSVAEILELVCGGVREQAYLAAGLSPQPADAKELTNEEFNQLTMKIIHTATADGTLPHDTLTSLLVTENTAAPSNETSEV